MRGEIERHIPGRKTTTKMQQRLGYLRQPSFLTKIAEIAITSVLLGLYVGVYQWLLVYGDVHQMVLPFPVCGSFLIITGLICLADIFGQRTPTYLVMAYDIQGVLLFAAVGIVCFVCWGKATGESIIGPPPIHMPPTLDRPAILASAILGIVNSVVYALDTVLTYKDRHESFPPLKIRQGSRGCLSEDKTFPLQKETELGTKVTTSVSAQEKMSERICMNSMPENLQGSNQKLYRISSLSTLSSLTFGLPELPVIEATILNANKADPPLNFDELGTFPFYMKFIQLLLTIVCAGLHSDGINCIWDSTPGQMLPYVVCAVYMIINTVTIISYVLGQKMPECSLRIFGVIGCLLFAASGAVCLHFWGSYEPKEFKDVRTQILMARAPKMLMSEGFLFLANASLYVIDTCYSLQARRSRYALS